jgi:hypothetical protein
MGSNWIGDLALSGVVLAIIGVLQQRRGTTTLTEEIYQE